MVWESRVIGERRQTRVDLASRIAVGELCRTGLKDAGIEDGVALKIERKCEDGIGDEEKENVADTTAQERNTVEEDGSSSDDGEGGKEHNQER